MNNEVFNIFTTPRFDRNFKNLDNHVRRNILQWICKNICYCPKEHVYMVTDPLKTSTGMDYAFKIGVYHIIFRIEGNIIIILDCVDHTMKKEVEYDEV